MNVDEEGSLSLSGVFAAVTLLSRLIGSLPLKVYRESGRNRLPASAHPATRLLGWQPNPEMTAVTFRRTLDVHRLLWGNAYAEIGWAGNGVVGALWPVEPWRVQPKRDDQDRLYYRIDGERNVALPDMLHVPLISMDGVCGRSFIDYAVESLGLSLATQQYVCALFGNQARPGGILTHPGMPPDKQRKEMREGWDSKKSAGAFGTAVLWGGWQFQGGDSAFNAQESQLVEQRRFNIEEIARWFNIPPHLLRELSRATFSNIEHQGIDFVVYSLGPVLVDYEQEYDRKLLSPPSLYCKHNVASLLRGDSAARSAYYREMFGIGAFSINDILDLEERNPIPGGDVHFVPANMMTLERAIAGPPAPQPPQQPPQQNGRIHANHA